VDMVLLDWTRMGRSYCLAGAVAHQGQYRVVRPLLARHRAAAVRNVGWSPYLMDGYARWDVFELVGPEAPDPQPPHLEDVWVSALRPGRRTASPAERRAILQATLPPADPVFGAPLTAAHAGAFLAPGAGARSLASVVVPAGRLAFSAACRDGALEPDYRVKLPLPGLDERILPVKDHFLLRQAETASADLEGRVRALTYAVRQLGESVVVRLGLSRPFQSSPAKDWRKGPSSPSFFGGRMGGGEGGEVPPPGPLPRAVGEGSPVPSATSQAACWLMADGFFSLTDPQP
jgi:hypothetical protein